MISGLIEWGVKKAVYAFVKKKVDDPAKAAEAEQELMAELMKTVEAANKAQTDINMKEAEHASLFVAGWRPFIGWVCGAGFAFQFVLRPILNWGLLVTQSLGLRAVPEIPALDIDQLMVVLTGMLGLGTMRMMEKFKGVSRERSPARGKNGA